MCVRLREIIGKLAWKSGNFSCFCVLFGLGKVTLLVTVLTVHVWAGIRGFWGGDAANAAILFTMLLF